MTTKPTFGDVRSALHNAQPLPDLWHCVPEAVEYLTPKPDTLRLMIPDLFTDGALQTRLRVVGEVGDHLVTYHQWNDEQSFDFFAELVCECHRAADGGPGDYKARWRPHHVLGAPLPLHGAPCDAALGRIAWELSVPYRHGKPHALATYYQQVAELSPDPVIALRAGLSTEACYANTTGMDLDRLCGARYDDHSTLRLRRLGSSTTLASREQTPMFGHPGHRQQEMIVAVGAHPPSRSGLTIYPCTPVNRTMRNPPGWSVQKPYTHIIWEARCLAVGVLPPAWRKQCAVEVEVRS
jgi:hypothetical protein